MTESILHPILSVANKHQRDDHIQFEEAGHKYTILTDPTSKYTSVTTWNHSHFPKFNASQIIKNMMSGKNWKEGHKYWGMSADQIKQQWQSNGAAVSGAGTDMHFEIECFMNEHRLAYPYTHGDLYEEYILNHSPGHYYNSKPIEWQYFIEYIRDHPTFKPYRTEWLIYDEDLKMAGSIDMVYEKHDGTLAIYDWKRSKDITKVNPYNKYAVTQCISHLHDANFWHYALQLNTYKAILEKKYGKKVSELCLVRLHPDAEEKTYELLPVPDMQPQIQELFELRRKELSIIDKNI
jgi:ATP-dependent exoDNAse (exonuclease V) beta subunit